MAKIIADRRITGRKIDDQRGRVQANVKDWHDYFKPNYERFNFWRNFVFKSSLSSADISLNQELNRPQIEFNIMEAKLSRLLGEFAKQEPNLTVHQADLAMGQVNPQVIQIVEGYIRSIFFESNRDNMEYEVYRDIISGGYSAFKVITEYQHEMSFDQVIKLMRCFDPTLIGFDKLATQSHKGDGMYCYELFPQSCEEFEAKYGSDATSKMSFTRKVQAPLSPFKSEFNWSYENDKEKIVMICDYYEKKQASAKIVRLRTGEVMTVKEYENLLENWDYLEVPPTVVGKPRETQVTTIVRHRIVENDTLEYVETDYKYLPLIFVDGNSIMLRGENGGAAQQMTRPMMYHMLGTQKLKNFVGIMLANHIENSPQAEFMAPEESIPAEYKDPWINPQTATGVRFYKAYKDNDVDQPLPPPTPIVKPVMPPEFLAAFQMTDQLSQTILGTFDSALGINDNQLSGTAIQNGATQSNAASAPFMVGYIRALNRAAEIIVDLLPKYVEPDTPRSLPMRDSSGKRDFAIVNAQGMPQMDYDSNALGVKVEAGVNFEIQRQQAFQMLSLLMERVPLLNQFIGSEEAGLEMLLDNVDIRGIDSLKAAIKPFVQQVKQQQQQQAQAQSQQMQMMMAPLEVEKQKVQQRQEQAMMSAMTDEKQRLLDEYEAETARMMAIAKIGQSDQQLNINRAKLAAEEARTELDLVQSVLDTDHKQTMDYLNLHQKVDSDARKHEK